MRRINKKGVSIYDAPALIIALVVIGIVASLGLTVMGQLWDTIDTTGFNTTLNYVAECSHPNYTCTSAEANATESAMEGISNFSDLLPVIGIVVAIVIVLGVIFMLWRPGVGSGI